MTKKIVKVMILGFSLVTLLCYGGVFANQSDIDPSFHFNSPVGADTITRKIAVQPDGKIIAIGGFSSYNGIPMSKIMRLHKDFSLDTSFNIGAGFDTGSESRVLALALQPDGKILVGGGFLKYQGISIPKIIRINSDGSLDTSFNMTGIISNNGVSSITVQSDGKILVGGGFTTSGGISRGVIRLNANGLWDSSFDIGTGINNGIDVIKIQNDGKILMGGSFTTYAGVTTHKLIRLNQDGSRDTSFDIGSGFNSYVREILIDENDKIIVGGYFTTYQGVAASKIIRLNDDGSRDASFNIGAAFTHGSDVAVHGMTIDKNGKIVVTGMFRYYQGANSYYLIRLNADGSRDNSFNMGTAFGNGLNYNYDVEIGVDDKIIVAGSFSEYQGLKSPRYIIAINPDGSRDENLNNITKGFDRTLSTLSMQNDGKIIAGGFFQMYEKTLSPGLVRLNPDGSRDISFNVGSGFNVGQNGYDYRWVGKTVIDGSGKILAIGAFTTYQGVSANKIIRLNADGSRDNTFNIGTAFDSDYSSNPKDIILQADGKILVWGSFTTYQGVSVGKIIRLNPDGSRDTTLPDIGTGFSGGYISSVGIDPDGKFIIAGSFTSHQGLTGNHIVRLNQDGSRDMTFDSGIGFTWYPNTIVIQPDGKILVGGNIYSYQGVNIKGVVRINTNGSIDTGFVAANIFDRNCGQEVVGFIVQPDEKIIAWGGGKLVRFNSNGSLDTSFIADEVQGCEYGKIFRNTGPSLVVVSPNGNIIIAGNFTSYRGIPVDGFFSMFGNSSVVDLPNSTNIGTIANAFTTKGYIETNGQFYGIAPISLSETDGTIPTQLNITNTVGTISLPQGTQVITTSNSENYSGIISVPFGAQFIKSIGDMGVLSIFKVGSDLNKLSLLGNNATISVPISGNVGDSVYIYYSNNNQGSWYPEKISNIINNNGVPYVSFTTNHLAEFAILGRSGVFTGGFRINNSASITNTRSITLNIYANPIAQMMRFSNDNITRSNWEVYATSKTLVLNPDLGEHTVYTQLDVNGDGSSDIYTTQNIIYNDTLPPTISLIGNSIVNVDQNSTYIDAGAIASDDRDGNISANIIVSGYIDTSILGSYILTYNVSDALGNHATEVIRTVNIVSPNSNTPPSNNESSSSGNNESSSSSNNGSGSSPEDTTPPSAQIVYTTNPNGSVLATLTDFNEPISWVNAETYLFTSDGEFTFEFEDLAGNRAGITASVEGIGSSHTTTNTSNGGGNGITTKDIPLINTKLVHGVADTINPIPANISHSTYSVEINDAYLRAYKYGVTTIPIIQQANIEGNLIRKDMAKMISNFAINVLEFTISGSDTRCAFTDTLSLPTDTQKYITTACQLGLMGYESDGITLKKKFDPMAVVERSQFGTILSRILWGNKNNGGSVYYQKHLDALKTAGIMKKITSPSQKEIRGYVMLMMMRSAK